jgi:hypothetical protein
MLCSSLDFLDLTTSSNTLGGEEPSQVPMLRLTPSIGLRTSKLKVGMIRGDLLLDSSTGWLHEVA